METKVITVKYETPEIDLILFDCGNILMGASPDIIAPETGGDGNDGGFGDDDSGEEW